MWGWKKLPLKACNSSMMLWPRRKKELRSWEGSEAKGNMPARLMPAFLWSRFWTMTRSGAGSKPPEGAARFLRPAGREEAALESSSRPAGVTASLTTDWKRLRHRGQVF